MLLHSCESISTRLEGTTSTSAECHQISIDHRPRALDGGAEVRESDIQASTDSPNRRRRNTARIDSKPANPLLIPSYAAGCVSQKNSPDLGGTPLTLTEVFGWMCVIPLTPLLRYYGPGRHRLAFARFPGFAGYTIYLAPPISRWDEDGFSSCSTCPCHRAVPTTPPK